MSTAIRCTSAQTRLQAGIPRCTIRTDARASQPGAGAAPRRRGQRPLLARDGGTAELLLHLGKETARRADAKTGGADDHRGVDDRSQRRSTNRVGGTGSDGEWLTTNTTTTTV